MNVYFCLIFSIVTLSLTTGCGTSRPGRWSHPTPTPGHLYIGGWGSAGYGLPASIYPVVEHPLHITAWQSPGHGHYEVSPTTWPVGGTFDVFGFKAGYYEAVETPGVVVDFSYPWVIGGSFPSRPAPGGVPASVVRGP